MQNLVIFIGSYSPAFLSVLDTCSKKKEFDLIYIESAAAPSTVPSGILSAHITSLGIEETLKNIITQHKSKYSKIFAFALSYQHSLIISRVAENNAILIPMVPDTECIDKLKNKKVMTDIAEKVNLPVLSSVYLDEGEQDVELPIVIRPTSEDDAQFKVALVHTEKELAKFTAKPVIAQKMICGPNLVAHVVKSDSSFQVKYFIATHKFQGVTLAIEQIEENTFSYLDERLNLFLAEIGFNGVGHFEFIMNSTDFSELYFLEFNGRLGGTTLKCYSLGYNEVQMLFSMYNLTSQTGNDNRLTKASNIVALIKYLLVSFTQEKDPLDYPQQGKMASLFTFFKLLTFTKNELNSVSFKVSFAYFIDLLKGKFIK